MPKGTRSDLIFFGSADQFFDNSENSNWNEKNYALMTCYCQVNILPRGPGFRIALVKGYMLCLPAYCRKFRPPALRVVFDLIGVIIFNFILEMSILTCNQY